MNKIVILGAGRIGQTIAIDLCHDFQVKVADISEQNLSTLSSSSPIQTSKCDLGQSSEIKAVIAEADLVICAMPGFMGFNTLKTIIESGKNVVDISFFDEDPFLLDELAKRNNVIAVVDCGVAPGMDNIILGYHSKRMKVDSFECLVGGLPLIRTWPYEYKAPFSPIDVIAEYTRPSRIVKEGCLITRPALSDSEMINFPQVGTLEAFNTDGLRSLVKTMKVPNMIERTLRYPGHINYMKVLRESGFFSEESIIINGSEIRPIDLTSRLLFPMWKLEKDEEDFTIMRITIEGQEKEKSIKYVYNLYDRYDKETKIHSMSRTTGFTCTAVARLILKKMYTNTGINPPEYIGEQEDCYNEIIRYLKARGVTYQVESTQL